MTQHSTQALRHNYLVERELADRLRNAPDKETRRKLYGPVYDELFQRVPDEHQKVVKANPALRQAYVKQQLGALRQFLTPNTVFLEVGPGDCGLSLAVTRYAKKVYAVDVASLITENTDVPANFEFVQSDGTSVPVTPGSVDLAYSMQVMEHLHPEDGFEQVSNIARALKPGGKFVCMTPNRISGPHDISKFFDSTATCLHLKEYTNAELIDLFKRAGFRNITAFLSYKGTVLTPVLPSQPMVWLENLIAPLPQKIRQTFGHVALIGIKLIATK
jgi:SAM-dependent methyltransferase